MGLNSNQLLEIHNPEEKEIRPEDFFETNKYGTPIKFIPSKLGDYILTKLSFKTLKDNERIYVYKDGYYQEQGTSVINEVVTKILKDYFTRNRVIEVLTYIKYSTQTNEINLDWINFKNGLFNPITKEFREHTPDLFIITQLPYEYNSESDCPLWKEKLKEKCDEDWKYQVIQEWFGYHFLKGQKYEKALIFYGQKETMKSTTLYILGKMLGDNNICGIPLQQLTEDYIRSPIYLYGKLGNICSDLSKDEIKSIGWFLRWVGGDLQTGGKKYEHYITFYPDTKLTFSCNTIPSVYKKGDEFYRRWLPLEFNIPHTIKDPDLKDKLESELSGIFNWSIEGLDRLLKNNKFSYPYSIEKTKNLWEKNSESVDSFIYDMIEEDDENKIKKRDVYFKYKKYCKQNKLDIENVIKFGRKFKEITGCGLGTIDNIPSYSGIKFKEELEERDLEVII